MCNVVHALLNPDTLQGSHSSSLLRHQTLHTHHMRSRLLGGLRHLEAYLRWLSEVMRKIDTNSLGLLQQSRKELDQLIKLKEKDYEKSDAEDIKVHMDDQLTLRYEDYDEDEFDFENAAVVASAENQDKVDSGTTCLLSALQTGTLLHTLSSEDSTAAPIAGTKFRH